MEDTESDDHEFLVVVDIILEDGAFECLFECFECLLRFFGSSEDLGVSRRAVGVG